MGRIHDSGQMDLYQLTTYIIPFSLYKKMNLKIHTSGDATTDVGWINKQRMAGNWGKSMNWE